MSNLSRFILGASLLSCAVTGFAGSTMDQPANHNGFSVGAQGAGGMAFVATTGRFINTANPAGAADAGQAQIRVSSSAPVAFYGLNVGYNWYFQNSALSLNVSANEGAGKTKSVSFVSSLIATDPLDLEQITTMKEQYNLMLEWKHRSTNDLYFLAGVGFSALETGNTLQVYDSTQVNNASGNPSSTLNHMQLGGALRLGTEYFLSEHSAFKFSVDYYVYSATHLRGFDNILLSGTKAESVKQRARNVSLITMGLGYSYYF